MVTFLWQLTVSFATDNIMETLLGLLPSSTLKNPVTKKIDYKRKPDKVAGARFLHECGKCPLGYLISP